MISGHSNRLYFVGNFFTSNAVGKELVRPLILGISAMSLDGLIATERPTDTDEFSGAGDAELDQWIVDSNLNVGTFIMGRTTYLAMAEYWPNSTELFAAPMNSIPKVVFSKSLNGVTWTNSTIASGDTVDEVQRLKAQAGGPISALGGIKFLQSLAALDVVDEYHLLLSPHVAGSGQALFSGVSQKRGMKLVSSKQFDSG